MSLLWCPRQNEPDGALDGSYPISLPEDLEAWARAEVEAGRAKSVEALVAQAVRERRAEIEFVRGKLDEVRETLARGEGISLEDALEEIDSWIEEDEAAKTLPHGAE